MKTLQCNTMLYKFNQILRDPLNAIKFCTKIFCIYYLYVFLLSYTIGTQTLQLNPVIGNKNKFV